MDQSMKMQEQVMDARSAAIFSRNLGILTPAGQDRLLGATIGIAGVGGVGGLLAERLIRLGVGRLKLTDPGTFEESNLNRQFGSSTSTLGQKKVEAVFAGIQDINPQARIDLSDSGITSESSAADFVRDCDLVIDEMDFGLFRESILLQRAARRRGVYYLFASAMAFGALMVVFDPHGCTLEEYDGLPPNVDVDDPAAIRVPMEKIAPIVPSYFRGAAADDIVQKILAGEMAGPTVSIGVGLAALLAANEAVNVLLHRREIPVAPRYTYVDLMDQRFVVEQASAASI
jgi:molybdopterin/thiamine biosynthesis adenylyltransferase